MTLPKSAFRYAPTVVVVDDQVEWLDQLSRTLGQSGCHVTAFQNPVEAWEHLSTTMVLPDVIILDKQMPELDGMELLRRLKSHPRTENIPVVMQTCIKGVEVESLAAGASSYLSKPYSINHLLKIISELLETISKRKALLEEYEKSLHGFHRMYLGCFSIETLEHASEVSSLISSLAEEGERVSKAILELLSNAVKHGDLLNDGAPVDVHVEVEDGHVHVKIKDHGEGFDWHKYTSDNPPIFLIH